MERKELILHVAENLKNGRSELDGLSAVFDGGDSYPVYFDRHELYLVKPRTHIVNGFEVPAPMTEKPKIGDKIFIPREDNVYWFDLFNWDGKPWIERLLNRNSCFATKKAAIANAKARCGIDPSGE